MRENKIAMFVITAVVALSLYTAWPSADKPFFGEGEPLHGCKINLGLDLQGGSELRVALDRRFLDKGANVEKETERAIEVLERRINIHGLKEPRIQRFGEDQVIIQLPGIDAAEAKRVKEIVTKSGKLEFRIEADEDVVRRASFPDKAPRGYRWFARTDEDGGSEHPVLVRDESKLTGDKVKTAAYSLDSDNPGSWEVSLTFNSDGRRVFADLTRQGVGRRIAIILDGKLVSAPVGREPITGGTAQITGGFKMREATDLATVLRSGSLPAPLNIVAETFVGPTLGEDSIEKGAWAFGISISLVLAFMLMFYRGLGIAANIALVVNMALLLGCLAIAGATLTLPGIAGIVLTLGMAVDANIIIYERIRDEVEKGKGTLQAFEAGFDRAFWTVFDANLTTFIAGLVLYGLGSGAVKGFAVTLNIGIFTTMVTALWVTKYIIAALLHTDVPLFKIQEFKIARIIDKTNFKFMAMARKWCLVSAGVLGVTMLVFLGRGSDNFGIDFNGGTVVDVAFRQAQGIEDVRAGIRGFTVTDEQGTRQKYSDAEVQSISSSAQGVSGGGTSEFSIRTGAEDATAFRADLTKLFGDKLGSGPLDTLGKLEMPNHPYNGGERIQVNLVTPLLLADFDKQIKDVFEKANWPKPITRSPGAAEGAEAPTAPQSAFEVILHPTLGDKFIEVKNALSKTVKLQTDPFTRVESIGPSVARTFKRDSFYALIASWIGIILYLAVRFDLMFGLAAVIALIHDVLIAIGVTSVVAWLLPSSMGISLDVGTTAVAAYLTIIGYSVNDTIVTFDRIRETMLGEKTFAVADVVDRSINETLSRSLMTSVTVFMTVFVLFVVNARSSSGISEFAFPMLVGTIVGCYSSIFIASPLVVWVGGRSAKVAAEAKPQAAGA